MTEAAAGAPGGRVVAVVVTYRPEPDALGTLLASLADQVAGIVIVDNGSGMALAAWLEAHAPANSVPVFLGENRGLATAQNLGVARARGLGADYVLFSDQDSLPAPDMVECLLAAARAKQDAGIPLASVGPRYFDTLQGRLSPFVRVRGLRVRRFDCAAADQVVEVDHLISSGSLIPMAALDAVGPMRDELFIDYVDTEWSLRAWRAGYRSFGVCRATMRHGLGDRPYRLLGRYVPIHSALRHYYLFRNTIWLYRQGWIPWTWKVATARRMFLKLMFFAIVPKDRWRRVRMMSRGMWDGLRGRMGRFDEGPG